MIVSRNRRALVGPLGAALLGIAMLNGAGVLSAADEQPRREIPSPAANPKGDREVAVTMKQLGPKGHMPAEVLMAQAMQRNPAIVALKAKVAAAEAELLSAQADTARQITELVNKRGWLNEELLGARNQLKRLTTAHTAGQVAGTELDAASAAVFRARFEVERNELAIRFLTGAEPLAGNQAAGAFSPLAAPIQVPQGPAVDKLRQALDAKVNAECAETPLSDVLAYFSDLLKLPLVVDQASGVGAYPVTMHAKEASFGPTLQMLQDTTRGIVFVVRDYGILATSPEQAKQKGYLPLAEFVRQAKSGGKP